MAGYDDKVKKIFAQKILGRLSEGIAYNSKKKKMRTYTHIHTHTYKHLHTQTHTDTYIHIFLCTQRRAWYSANFTPFSNRNFVLLKKNEILQNQKSENTFPWFCQYGNQNIISGYWTAYFGSVKRIIFQWKW